MGPMGMFGVGIAADYFGRKQQEKEAKRQAAAQMLMQSASAQGANTYAAQGALAGRRAENASAPNHMATLQGYMSARGQQDALDARNATPGGPRQDSSAVAALTGEGGIDDEELERRTNGYLDGAGF